MLTDKMQYDTINLLRAQSAINIEKQSRVSTLTLAQHTVTWVNTRLVSKGICFYYKIELGRG